MVWVSKDIKLNSLQLVLDSFQFYKKNTKNIFLVFDFLFFFIKN